MRRPRFSNSQPRLRAGMTPSVIAEIGARGRVPGLVALRAVARIATALLHYSDVGAGVVIGVIGVIVGPIIIWVAVVGVGIGRECAADHRTGDSAGEEMALMEAAAMPVSAAIPGGAVAGPGSAGADAPRSRGEIRCRRASGEACSRSRRTHAHAATAPGEMRAA